MASQTTVQTVQDGKEKMAESNVQTGDTTKLEKVTVTLTENESAAIISTDAVKVIATAFELQDDYDNASMFQRDALAAGAVLFLKAEIARAISQWDNLVTKMSKTTRFRNRYTREQLDKFLRTNPKCKELWKRAELAAKLKASL